ncbi:hexose transporter [Dichomitus squalens]|uniref:Hexose transporter n=2 Tax=Dichomitus squalens TaxID=114155 RepID=A0A4Q9MBW7_9APHY|nr:hexose transporter [Dichomitus squalens LYAD-421 SS1]EJF62162.1 hexose transporter [Dichomitus squalens LYAD-421 SS1]TBU23967.1 hexose transporter [Dichomitus squalens]TBU42673.1 hexose transporter [Dichomitus squalens]TBU58659.1 hexose transporter [Dichomitus squalens]
MAIGVGRNDTALNRYIDEDKVPWYRKKNLRLLYLLMFPTCIGIEMTSGFDSSMMNGLQAVPTWDAFFGHPRSTILGLLSALYSLGSICSLPFVPLVTDKLGRRWAIAFGSVIMIIGAALQCASQDFAMFVIARFLLGFGIPFAIVAASSMIGELAHPKERARMGSLFNASWFIGAIVAAGVTLGTFQMPTNWGWRIPSILQVTPSVLQIVFIWFLPESPRWLISKGRGEEAYAVLAKFHAEGDVNSEFVKLEYAEIEKTLELEKEQQKGSWREFVLAPGMRKRLLICSFLGLATQWSGNGLTSYFLARILDSVGITDDRTQNLINLAMTCWGFINGTALALTMPKLPRRVGYLACTISLTVIFTAWTVASAKYAETGSQGASRAVIAFIFLYSPAYNMAYNALTYTFLVELFPFHARAKGIAVFQWWSRAAGFFNQFVNPIGIANAGWKYYISYCVFLVFEILFVYFLFPETANRSLEELAFLYEGDKVRAEQQKRVEEDMLVLENKPPIPEHASDKESAFHVEVSKI